MIIIILNILSVGQSCNARNIFSQLNSFSLDFYFFFYLLVVGDSSTDELKLYNPLKHSLVLSIGYTYSAQFMDYFVCSSGLLLGAAF